MGTSSQKIGRWHGAGLLATTLLGTSVFILPQMTIGIAGQWAVLSWALIVIAILPVAVIFAKLSALYPHAGGPAYFVEKAFGVTTGRTIGLMFLFVVPIGAPAAIIMTCWFIETLFQVPADYALPLQLSIVAILFALNYRGIQLSAALQLGLTFAITCLVLCMLVGASAQQTISFSQFTHSPLDTSGLLTAMGLAFWSFLGIEAMSHLANDFRNPSRDFLPAVMIGTLVVGVIYIGCTLLLVDITSSNVLVMVEVFDQIFSGYGAIVIGALGVGGGLATVNVYTASLSRLVWSLSKDGVLPTYFSQLNQHQVPQRALQLILIAMSITIVVSHLGDYRLEDLIGWVNGVFVMMYLASLLAAFKLVPSRYHLLIWLGCAFCLTIAIGLGQKMMYALVLFSVFSPLLWMQQQRLLKSCANND